MPWMRAAPWRASASAGAGQSFYRSIDPVPFSNQQIHHICHSSHSAQIRRRIAPNTRRVSCPSASRFAEPRARLPSPRWKQFCSPLQPGAGRRKGGCTFGTRCLLSRQQFPSFMPRSTGPSAPGKPSRPAGRARGDSPGREPASAGRGRGRRRAGTGTPGYARTGFGKLGRTRTNLKSNRAIHHNQGPPETRVRCRDRFTFKSDGCRLVCRPNGLPDIDGVGLAQVEPRGTSGQLKGWGLGARHESGQSGGTGSGYPVILELAAEPGAA